MTNFSIPQTRIPPCRYRDVKGASRRPKTRQQLYEQAAREYNNANNTCVPKADKPIPMPQAHVAKDGEYHLRWSAVPAGDRPRMQAYRKSKCVATGKPGGGFVSVSWDGEPSEVVPVKWLADAPEWV